MTKLRGRRGHRRRSVTVTVLAAVASLMAGACGATSDGDPVEAGPPAGTDGTDGTASGTGGTSDGGSEGGGSGLGLRVTGLVVDGALCPGGQRPCLPFDGEVTPDADGGARVVGDLEGGVLHVRSQEPVPDPTPDFGDRCGPEIPASGDDTTLQAEVTAYTTTIPDTYALIWLSNRQVFHLGVVGDPEPHRQALAERGLTDRVCVVGDFLRSEAELATVSSGVGEIIQARIAAAGPAGTDDYNGGWSADHFVGAVVIDLYRVGTELTTELRDRFGEAVVVNAAIEVLDGTLADLDAALTGQDPAGAGPEPHLTCGAVTFPSTEPDLAQFPPIDAEATTALEQAARTFPDPTGGDLVTGHRWTVADRSDTRLVLFGQDPTGRAGASDDGDGGAGADGRHRTAACCRWSSPDRRAANGGWSSTRRASSGWRRSASPPPPPSSTPTVHPIRTPPSCRCSSWSGSVPAASPRMTGRWYRW